MAATVIFARHGESTANLSRTFANRGRDWPLTQLGEAQARALCRDLRRLPVSRVLSSPLRRAEQTAEVVAARFGVPVEVRHELAEFDVGRWEGKSDSAGWDEYAKVMEEWRRGFEAGSVGGGESLADVVARFAPLAEELRGMGSGTILCIGHGGTYRAALPGFLENVDRAFAFSRPFPNTGLVVATIVGSRAVCEEWCGVKPRTPA